MSWFSNLIEKGAEEVSKKTGIGNGRGPKFNNDYVDQIGEAFGKATGIGYGHGEEGLFNIAWRPVDNFMDNVGDGLNFLMSEDFTNAFVNTATGGVLGYDDGNFEKGFLTRGIDEGIGELTGRNIQRRMANLTEQQIAEQKRQYAQDRKDAVNRQKQYETTASQRAASRKGGSTGSSGYSNGGGDGVETEGRMATDFLGL